jgi:hypothetical protein
MVFARGKPINFCQCVDVMDISYGFLLARVEETRYCHLGSSPRDGTIDVSPCSISLDNDTGHGDPSVVPSRELEPRWKHRVSFSHPRKRRIHSLLKIRKPIIYCLWIGLVGISSVFASGGSQ